MAFIGRKPFPMNVGELSIDDFYVLPAYRKKGIANAMVQLVDAKARQDEYKVTTGHISHSLHFSTYFIKFNFRDNPIIKPILLHTKKFVLFYDRIKNKSCDKLATPPPLAVAIGISFLISSDRSAVADVSFVSTVL